MNKKILTTSIMAAAMIGLSGCGPSDTNNTNTNNKQTKLNGKVADGYIKNANVVVDILPNNGKYDSGQDIQGSTDDNGDFNITASVSIPTGTFIYATGGKNVSTDKDFNGTLRAVYGGDGKITLTPLTTLVAAQFDGSSDTKPTQDDINKAKQAVAKALGIDKSDVDADPVQNKKAFKATMKVVAASSVLGSANGKTMTDALEDIANQLKDDANLSKAIENVAGDDKKIAEKAKKAGEIAESLVDSYEDNLTADQLEAQIDTNVIVPSAAADANMTEIEGEANTTAEIASSDDNASIKVLKLIASHKSDYKTTSVSGLLNNVKHITKDSSDKVAKVMYDVADALKTTMDKLGLRVDALADYYKLKHEPLKYITKIPSQADSAEVAAKLHKASTDLMAIYTNDDSAVEVKADENKSLKLNKNDAQLLAGVFDATAAAIEYSASYNIIDPKYLAKKTKEIDGKTYSYRDMQVNPLKALKDATTLSLGTDAQTHLTQAKNYLLNAIDLATNYQKSLSNIQYLKNINPKTVTDLKNKLATIKNSVSSGENFAVKYRDTEIALKLSALFDASTAPTMSNTVGNDFTYRTYNGKAYNEDNSIKVGYPTIDSGNCVAYPEYGVEWDNNTTYCHRTYPRLQSIPTDSNDMANIIKQIKADGKAYSGSSDITKVIYGRFKLNYPNHEDSYSKATDVKIDYKIVDGLAGSTAPYSCNISNSSADITLKDSDGNSSGYDNKDDVLQAKMIDNNTCEVTMKDTNITDAFIQGDITFKDAYGHGGYGWVSFKIGNP